MDEKKLVDSIRATTSLLNAYLQDAYESGITMDIELVNESEVISKDRYVIIIKNYSLSL